jgi:hypothetical protein
VDELRGQFLRDDLGLSVGYLYNEAFRHTFTSRDENLCFIMSVVVEGGIFEVTYAGQEQSESESVIAHIGPLPS